MPNKVIDLRNFNYGIIKRADPMDIPLQAASDSNNIDGDATEGKLQAIPTANDVTATKIIFNAKRGAWIIGSDNKWNFVYVSGITVNALQILKDFYGTPANQDLSVAYNGYSFVVHNQECHIGCGQTNASQFVGYLPYGRFSGSAIGWIIAKIDLDAPTAVNEAISATPHAGTAAFDSLQEYDYTFSYVYDYTQESPLYSGWSSYTPATDGNADYVTIRLTVTTSASVPSRVTGIKIYRRIVNDVSVSFDAEGYNSKSVGAKGLYRLMKTYDLTLSTGWTVAGAGYYIEFVDDNGSTTPIGATYEQETGIAENITTSNLKYTLNCQCNNYLFASGCSKTGVPDASHMIFRSQAYRYDMFNWSAIGTYLKLPTLPTAMVTFNNRVWAFDENNIYVINPDAMIVEETIFGIGCLSQRSVNVTPYGMYWCDEKNAYWHDGQKITPIGEGIKSDLNVSPNTWHGFPINYNYTTDAQDKRPIVVFSPAKSYILFIIPYDTGTDVSNVWAWHVSKKRWDCWRVFTLDCGGTFGAFTGKNGEVYAADGNTKLYDCFGGAGWRDFYWTSGELPKEEQGQTTEFYRPIMRNTSTTSAPVITYGIDAATPTTNLTSGEFKTGGVYEKGNTIQLKVTEATGYGNTVSNIEIVCRQMKGNR